MSPRDAPNIGALWGSLIVEELIRNGIDYFVVSPGSRCTPLVQAIANNPQARATLWLDERGAGFHALGFARATGRPAAVVTTSGTAVANLLPATVEASLDGVPMILLTADRPPELREVGANQSIRQPGIFSDHVRWTFDLPAPDDRTTARMVLTTVDHAVGRAEGTWHGPVQINCPFREPLAPVTDPWNHACLKGLEEWLESDAPFTVHREVVEGRISPDADGLADLRAIFGNQRDVLVVAGRMAGWTVPHAEIRETARRMGWPLYADLRSGFRLGEGRADATGACCLPHLDRLLGQGWAPKTVLQFGAHLTSKRLQSWLDTGQCEQYIVVDRSPVRLDPGHVVTQRLEMDPLQFCEALVLACPPEEGTQVPAFLTRANRRIEEAIEATVEAKTDSEEDLAEPWVARWLSKQMEPGQGLFLSNSMPIRDMQAYAIPDGPWLRVEANRGASGIDGIVSSAAGFAEGLVRPTTLLIGDLALLHDLNALARLRDLKQALTIVVLNNGGGSIFSFLPIADHERVLTPLVNSPHDVRFEGICFAFGLPYTRVHTRADFREAYRSAAALGRTAIVEVASSLASNRTQHERLEAAIAASIAGDIRKGHPPA